MKDIDAEIDDLIMSPMPGASAYEQLRPVERIFVDAYLSEISMSATQAGQSVIDHINTLRWATKEQRYNARFKVAHWHANEMVKKPLVQAAIWERVEQISKHMEISAYRILAELKGIAFSSVAHYIAGYDISGMPITDFRNATPEQMAAVQSIETEYDANGCVKKVKYKLHDKMAAVDKLMKYMGMLDGEGTAKVAGQSPARQQQIAANTSTAQAADLYAKTLRGEA